MFDNLLNYALKIKLLHHTSLGPMNTGGLVIIPSLSIVDESSLLKVMESTTITEKNRRYIDPNILYLNVVHLSCLTYTCVLQNTSSLHQSIILHSIFLVCCPVHCVIDCIQDLGLVAAVGMG